MTSREAARFWRLAEVADVRACWLWKGAQRNGYGCHTVAGRQHLAHRLAWSFIYSAIPAGKGILHSCDTPLCVNPRHLRPGTHEDNNLDKIALSRVQRVLAEVDETERREAAEAGALLESWRIEHRAGVIPGGPDGIRYASTEIVPMNRTTATKLAASPMTEDGVRYIRDLYRVHGVDFRTIAAVCRIPEWRSRAVITRASWRHIP